MIYTKYSNSGIILGADCNGMDITPILKCGLKLRQVVDQKTHGKKIIDILIMNTASFYKSPIIAPPIKPDNPLKAKASDHFVPVCFPHLNRYERPIRNRKIIQFRPLPQSNINLFGEWLVSEPWAELNVDQSPSEQVHTFEQILHSNLDRFLTCKN